MAGLWNAAQDAAMAEPQSGAGNLWQRSRRAARPQPHPASVGSSSFGLARRAAVQSAPGYSTADTAQAPAAHLADYAAQYQDSLARSRAAIEQQFRSAFEDIGKREIGAQAAINTLPGEVQGIYDRGKASLGQQAGALDAAQKASGLQSFMGADAQLAPLAAAQASDLATRQADVPLLRIGATTAFNDQRGALNQAQLSAMADLEGEQRGYFADLARQQEAAKIDAASQTDNFERDLMGKDWLAQQDFERQKEASGIEAKQARAEEARSLNTFGGQDISAARGQFLRDFQPGAYRRASSSSAYRRENARVRREQDGENDSNDIAGAIKRLQARGLYRTAAIFAQRHHAGRIK